MKGLDLNLINIIKSIYKKIVPKKFQICVMRIRRLPLDLRILELMKKTKNRKRYLLFLTPEYANIGDHAITICEKIFMKEYFKDELLIEIPMFTWKFNQKKLKKYVADDDCILIQGGGFLGSLWMEGEIAVREIINCYPNNKIVIFPQSVFYGETKEDKEQISVSKQVYNNHSKLVLCVRETNSYECVKNNELLRDFSRCILMPDMVTYYNNFIYKEKRRQDVLLCFRQDHERQVSSKVQDEIVNILLQLNLRFRYTDTVVSHGIPCKNREIELTKKMEEFAKAKFIITDRLHGMILSAITGTPCMFLDNRSKKVSGVYQWIKELGYIYPLKEPNDINDFVNQIVAKCTYKYHNEYLQDYFNNLAQVIAMD